MKFTPTILLLTFLQVALSRSAPALGLPVVYDSQANGNEFSGAKPFAALGFTDVHGGVATLAGGALVLTPDSANGGVDAYARDFVLRRGAAEQARDLGCRVVLPPNYRTGAATLGIGLRFQENGDGLLLNFRPDAAPALVAYSVAGGALTQRGSAELQGAYAASHPVVVEARAIGNAAMALTVTDLTTNQIIGFLNVPLDSASGPAGSFGLVPWMTSPGTGRIAVSSVQTYPVTAVVCDGNSLTTGENSTSGKGTASPLGFAYPGVLQKILGNRYHVFNLGRSGLTINAMNSDSVRRVDPLIVPAEKPPIVVLEGGTNDFGIDGSIKPPMPVQEAVQNVYARLQKYWGERHAARADVTMIDLMNMPAEHEAYVRNLGSRSGFNQRRDALNALRKNTTTGSRPDLVVDIASDSHIGRDGCEQNPTYFQGDDKTHLTDAGYAVKAALVADAILHGRKAPGGTR